MRLRFHDTCPSDAPGYPFLAGQIIAVDVLSAAMRQAVTDGRAEVLRDADELAVQGAAPDTAVVPRGRARGPR